MFSKRTLYLTMCDPIGALGRVVYVLKKGKVFLSSGVCSIEELKDLDADYLELCYADSSTFLETNDVKLHPSKHKLNEALMRRRVDDDSIMNGEYDVRFDVINSGSRNQLVAVEAELLANQVSPLRVLDQPLRKIVMLENSLAALLGKVTDEPVIALWKRGRLVVCLALEFGYTMAKSAMVLPEQDSGISVEDQMENLVDAVRSQLDYGGRQIPIVLLAEARQTISSDQELSEVEIALVDFVEDDRALDMPELIGIEMTNPVFDFISPEIRNEFQALSYADVLLKTSISAAVVLLIAAAVQTFVTLGNYEQLQEKTAAYIEDLADYNKRKPQKEQIESLSELTQLVLRARGGIRLDGFLNWMGSQVNKSIHVTSLRISDGNTKSGPRHKNRVALKKKLTAGSYSVVLEARVDGDYNLSKKTALDFVKRLSEKMEAISTRFDFTDEDASEKNGVLHANFVVSSAAFLSKKGLD